MSPSEPKRKVESLETSRATEIGYYPSPLSPNPPSNSFQNANVGWLALKEAIKVIRDTVPGSLAPVKETLANVSVLMDHVLVRVFHRDHRRSLKLMAK